MLSQNIIDKLIRQDILVDELLDEELAIFCRTANLAYRSGKPIISNEDYDFIYLATLKNKEPNNPLFKSIEPEGRAFAEEKVLLPELMLSIDKAYSLNEMSKWIERLEKSGMLIGLDLNTIKIKATPKLDGFAGFDDGNRLYTRGDGKKGSDISRVFKRGLCVFKDSGRGLGAGEIVVKKSYFEKYLAHSFEYPRNFQSSLIKEKALDEQAQKAIIDKGALFVPFIKLPIWSGSVTELVAKFKEIVSQVLVMVDFDVDGVVFEVINIDLKTQMGANRKFHRWQIAFKENKDIVQVKVLSVMPQVGRSGKITPVAEVEPTLLSGATIVRVTGHHYGLVKEQGLGIGSVVELTRSGLVIPKIISVLKPMPVDIPDNCLSCGRKLVWESDFLVCVNHKNCPAQIIGRITYFFKVLANNDGFGIATVEKLYAHNIRSVSQIYTLNVERLMAIGFGEKTSINLISQLSRSISEKIEDWRFLAAFGMHRMGLGNCENLLKSYRLNDIFDLTLEQITNIDGFAELTAQVIVQGLVSIVDEYNQIYQYHFNLDTTVFTKDLQTLMHELFDKRIVFTGKMSCPRNEMKKHAKLVGIKVSTTISNKIDYLVIGSRVGQKKIQDAKKLGVVVMTEVDYLSKITTQQ